MNFLPHKHAHTSHVLFLKSTLLALLLACTPGSPATAQTKEVSAKLATFFQNYPLGFNTPPTNCTLTDVQADDSARVLHIYVNEVLGMKRFTEAEVLQLYTQLKGLLPPPYTDYLLRVYSQKILIDDLVQGGWHGHPQRTWQHTAHQGDAWVTPLSRPFDIKHGLDGHHLCLWASHGRFYSHEENTWRWQRPRLFCTTEDLLSQTIVVPYLMPMLENAGAILYSPRERDWQRHEVIVDNDTPLQQGTYAEQRGSHAWHTDTTGFAHLQHTYHDGDDVFGSGTSRFATAQNRPAQHSTVSWTPDIPASGRYAVYVSYVSHPQAVTDAHYTVRHRGIDTHFLVNQQMGGRTWVYLGTFDFAAGSSPDNCVLLTNQSGQRGVVSADAVRFGGGMGNIARGADSLSCRVSGMPRFLEAARYSTQWYGMPYAVYANKQGANDYAEDINARSLALNYLAGGSCYLPADSGLRVPIELSLALHTDAGYKRDHSNIGSLGIYTTAPAEGMLPGGMQRLASRDLCDLILSQADADLRATYGQWNRRHMFDRNYSETREPLVPSVIFEMLSHQNFADLMKMHDPHFKFTLARAIYKGVLRFVSAAHGRNDAIVQPLPVRQLAADTDARNHTIRLTWAPTHDPLEPSATPTAYVVYHGEAGGDLDNGTVVDEPSFTLNHARTDVLHTFRVAALNSGGTSMPSATICAAISSAQAPKVLVVDAFDRLAGPYPVETDSTQGFDMLTDIGVPMARMPGYCGRQLCFDRKGIGREDSSGLGYSASELEGTIIAGNTQDWSVRHAEDMMACLPLNIASCTADALERDAVDPATFDLLDVICGLNKADGYSLKQVRAFPPAVRQAMATLTRLGGSVLTSGAFIGSDMTDDNERVFTRTVLKYEYAGALLTDSIGSLSSWDDTFSIYNQPNETSYMVPAADMLAPIDGAFSSVAYAPGGQSAAVSYAGTDYRTMSLGFPLESITDATQRRHLMLSILNFLLHKQ
ncbi:MAG: hypothetical protein IKO12_09210 [Bacteroidaceae bacterium]|nr:hypothetical protein [Bacteroidaceae bacterium]